MPDPEQRHHHRPSAVMVSARASTLAAAARTPIIAAMAAVALILSSCGRDEGETGRAEPADPSVATVYATQMDAAGDPRPTVVRSIMITSPSSEHAFRAFVDFLSEHELLPGPVSILGLERVDGLLVATVELIATSADGATDRWFQAFQGSAGGRATEIIVLWNLLQPDLSGAWPDALRLVYRGLPMDPLDHIDLSGFITRDEVRNP